MVPSCGSTSSARTPTARTAGSWPPRAATSAVVVDPGFEPAARARPARGRRQAPGRGARHPRPPRPRGHGAACSRATRSRCSCTRPTRSPSPTSGLGRRRADTRSPRCKDLRTVADGDVLAFAGFSIEVVHTPGHTPGHCCFRTDALLFTGDLVFAGTIGRSDFPNSDPAAMQASLRRFLTLPDALAGAAGARAGHDRRARTRHEPVPRGAAADGARPAAGHPGPAADRADAMLGAVRGAPTGSRASSATATSRRRRSSTPSCSRGRSGETCDVVTKEMYTFEDKGGRSVTLRPEGTAPVVRAYLERRARARRTRSRATTS